ncbi:hypothetical protein ABZT08_22280 [Streptomyces sp. NPDC005526]|uniref:hypothetical protein n=1 Tax=Streptomyces sp. NPDC005526 TaxID=3156885 RepID=UPI0033A2176C
MTARGKRRRTRTVTVGSYESPSANGPSERPSADDATAAFLLSVSDLVFRAGTQGIELRRMDVSTRTFEFCDTQTSRRRGATSDGRAIPTEETERAGRYWMPDAASPGWAHLAWLIQDLASLPTHRDYGPEGGPELVGLQAYGPDWVDVLLEHRDGRWRVRIRLEGRDEPLRFPAMALGELFGEGGHRHDAEPDEPDLIRDVL